MNEFKDPFLGNGWSFPPAFDHNAPGVEMTFGLADIQKSLQIIVTTTLGERIMQPTFGCGLDEWVFEPMNTSNLTFIKTMIANAILYHEPRIDTDEVNVRPEPNEGVLWISVSFTVRTTNSRFNFVFPYYLEENNS